MDLCLQFLRVDFQVSGFLDLEQLVSPDCPLVYFKESVIFLESDLPLCFDDFIVVLPYSIVPITNSFPLGLQPESTLSDAAAGTDTFFQNFLQVELMAASSVSEQVRQSLVADSGAELATLPCESLLEPDSLPLWLMSYPLAPTVKSLS